MTATRAVTFQLFGNGDPWRYPPLPLVVVDGSDEVIRRLTLTTEAPANAVLPGEDGRPLFAKLELPSGRTVVKPLVKDGTWQSMIEFEVGTESPHEWMAWSAMRVDLRRSPAPLMDEPGMDEAWLQLWELNADEGRWAQVPVSDDQVDCSIEGTQIELGRSSRPRALLVHLGTGTPQVIALPMVEQLMVLLTRAHALATSTAPRVLVGGYGSAAEGVLEFLRKGRLGSAGTMLDPGSELANQMLHDKIADPLAATAAAYYLLRKLDWERLPQSWLWNLASGSPWIPDATLLRDAAEIQRGMDPSMARALAARCLKDAFARGLPLFAEARWVIEDLLFYAEHAEGDEALTDEQSRLVRSILAAFQPAGLTFGFCGTAPDQPVPAQEAHRLSRVRELERRLRTIGSEMVDIKVLAPLVDPGVSFGVADVLEIAARGVRAAVSRFGALGRVGVPGDEKKTLFVKDLYDPGARRGVTTELETQPSRAGP